jgi:Leucine-rich repeat (LRR) protein
MSIEMRPKTPHIDLSSSNKLFKNEGKMHKNFSSFLKEIIETENQKFLSGETNVIDYLISKFTQIDLEDVKNLEKLSIVIKSDLVLMNQFGLHLPFLKDLRLSGSLIRSITDIGSNFPNLKILNVENCNLSDLSGIICFQKLEFLHASNNKISDIIEIEMCPNLMKVDFSNNDISDLENIYFLSGLSNLFWLSLNKNPIEEQENFSSLLKNLMPNVEYAHSNYSGLIKPVPISSKEEKTPRIKEKSFFKEEPIQGNISLIKSNKYIHDGSNTFNKCNKQPLLLGRFKNFKNEKNYETIDSLEKMKNQTFLPIIKKEEYNKLRIFKHFAIIGENKKNK